MGSQTEQQALVVRIRPVTDLTADFLHEWERLGRVSLEPNPFLSPAFLQDLPNDTPNDPGPSLWTVQKPDGTLVLLTALRPVVASSNLLFPHLSDKFSTYQFQGGMLLDPHDGRRALLTLLEHLKTTRYRHGLVFSSVVIDGPFSEQLYTAAVLSGFQTQLQGVWSRASLNFQNWNRNCDLLEACVSKNRRKSLRRARNKLERHGPVRFRIVDQQPELKAAAARFLDLEARGWKRTTGTAIGCNARHSAFFESVIQRMSVQESVLFGELLTGETVVASTCNFVAGETLFAFKIGWDPEMKEGSPGAWAEIELASWLARERPEITLLNSCSSAGSYLDRLWPHRLSMGNIVLSQSHRAVLYRGVCKTLRSAKRLFWPTGSSQRAVAE